MEITLIGPIWLLFMAVALMASVAWSVRANAYTSLSGRSAMVCVLPGVLMSLSFYALALHMYAALGGWPQAIGDTGFPASLVRHANMTFWYFEVMFLAVIFVWPAALVTCAIITRLRFVIPYLSIIAGSLALNFGLMLLGPSRFLTWWWD